MKFVFVLLFVAISQVSFAQFILRGRVVDGATGKALPFVNILWGEKGQGLSTNIDGQFEVSTPQPLAKITTSYVGYSTETIKIDLNDYTQPILIKLTAIAYAIDEVVVTPGRNPAHRIIDSVYANRARNNPENLESFIYRSYNKMAFNYQFDSVFYRTLLPKTMPAFEVKQKVTDRQNRFDSLMKSAPSIIMETVSERVYKKPNRNHEKVLATRMTGYSEPYAVLLATQMQSFSFYPETFTLMQKTFVSPVSRNAVTNYLFILEEQYLNESLDTVFVISFKPRKKSSFVGLKGILYINSNGYAIQNVLAQPDQPLDLLFDASIEQRYHLVDGRQWFPLELNMVLKVFPSRAGMAMPSRAKLPQYMVGSGKTYLSHIQVNPNVDTVKFSHVELAMHPDMFGRNESFWNQYRVDSLSAQELRSYRVLDSLGRVYKLDKISRLLSSLATGKLDLGYVAVDLNRIMNYNLFEGYRLGIGLETGSKVSKRFAIGGYYAYGFTDEREKYGVHSRLVIDSENQIEVNAYHQSDVFEPGSIAFTGTRLMANPDFVSSMFNNKREYISQYGGNFSFRIFRKFHATTYLNNNSFSIKSGFVYVPVAGDSLYNYSVTEAGMKLRIVWNESFAQSAWGILPISTGNPALWINYARGINAFGANIEYSRIEVRYRHVFDNPKFGKTQLVVIGGAIQGNVPISLLYFGRGNQLAKVLDGAESFNTMPPSTYVANRFASIFLSHRFLPMFRKLQGKKFNPRLGIVQRFIIGDNSNSYESNQQPYQLLGLSRGYWEPGIQIVDVFRTPFAAYGIGCSYGIGHHTSPNWKKNIAFSMNFTFVFQ